MSVKTDENNYNSPFEHDDKWSILDEFYYCCSFGHLYAIKEIVNYINEGKLPEGFADEHLLDNITYTQEFLTSTNSEGSNGLHYAAATGQKDVCIYLIYEIKLRNLPNKMGNTPLHWAVLNGHYDTTEIILNHPNQTDISVLATNKLKKSVLSYAFDAGDEKLIELILMHSSAADLVPEAERSLDLEEIKQIMLQKTKSN